MAAGRFVACGSGVVLTSEDGLAWTSRSLPIVDAHNGVAWSHELSLFVIANGGGDVMTSSDGVTWTVRTTPTTAVLNTAAWSAELGLFVVAGNGGTLLTSPDGVTWTDRATPGTDGRYGAAWSAELGLFVIAGGSGTVITSPDGVTWTSRSIPTSSNLRAATWSPALGLFLAAGWDATIITSPNGVDWTSQNSGTFNFFGATWSSDLGLFTVVGADGRIWTSPDGVTWTNQATPGLTVRRAAAWSPELGLFAVPGNSGSIVTSPNGVDWTSQSTPVTDTLYAVAWAKFNTPPNAPILTNPVGGAVIDRTATNRFAWDFNDPDTGDSQSQYELRYRLVGAATWTSVGPNATPNTFHDFAAAHFAAGDYEWQARTWDSQGEVGPWSASEFFTAADPPPSPSITDPISGQTIPSENYTVAWSAPSQDGGYEWRRVADNAGSPDTSVVYDGSTSPSTTARSRSISFPVNDRWEHVQWRIKDGGLWSQWASARVEVSYTPPGIPHVRVTSDVDHLTVRVYNSTAWGYGGTGVAKNAASPPLIDLDALGVGQVLWLPGTAGNYASTPDDASLDITGDIDLRAEVALEDWTPGSDQMLVTKRDGTAASYQLGVVPSGELQLAWTPDGSTFIAPVSSIATGFPDGEKRLVRATLDVDNGAATPVWEARFYIWDGAAWVQLGTAVTGTATTSIFAGGAPLNVGAIGNGTLPLKGKVLRAQVRNGIDGTLVADFNAADFTAPGTTGVDSTGKTWTINRSGDATAEIVDRNTWAFTGSEYLTLPDRDDLDFGAAEAFTVAASVATRTAASTGLLSKAASNTAAGYGLWKWGGDQLGRITTPAGAAVTAATINNGAWRAVAAERAAALVASVDGTAGTAVTATSDDLRNTEPFRVGLYPSVAYMLGLARWVALFRRVLTAAEHTELAGWDGTVATEPAWLRDEATLYVNADDPVQRTQYTARNLTLNLARTTDEGGVASDLPPVTANRVRRQRLDGTTWVDDPAGYLDLNGSPTIPADSDHPDWAVAHKADYRYEVEAVGDNDTSSRSGWVG